MFVGFEQSLSDGALGAGQGWGNPSKKMPVGKEYEGLNRASEYD